MNIKFFGLVVVFGMISQISMIKAAKKLDSSKKMFVLEGQDNFSTNASDTQYGGNGGLNY